MGIVHQYVFSREPGLLGILDKKTHGGEYYEFRDRSAKILLASRHEEFTLESSLGKALKGFYYPAGYTPSKTMALIVHGYRSNHQDTAGMFKRFYHSRGIDIFAIDQISHGKSEGELISFGYFESITVLEWIDCILEHFGPDIQIILHGFSMGGGTVLMASDRIPENVRFIIDDCGISGASETLRPRLGIMYQVMNVVNLVRNSFRFSLNMAESRPHLANCRCPVLFVHGRNDPTVPFSVGESLYNFCPTYKEHLWVDGAKHMESIMVDPDGYGDKVDSFIKNFC